MSKNRSLKFELTFVVIILSTFLNFTRVCVTTFEVQVRFTKKWCSSFIGAFHCVVNLFDWSQSCKYFCKLRHLIFRGKHFDILSFSFKIIFWEKYRKINPLVVSHFAKTLVRERPKHATFRLLNYEIHLLCFFFYLKCIFCAMENSNFRLIANLTM